MVMRTLCAEMILLAPLVTFPFPVGLVAWACYVVVARFPSLFVQIWCRSFVDNVRVSYPLLFCSQIVKYFDKILL